MPLILKPLETSSLPLEAPELIPSALRNLSCREIERIPLQCGSRVLPCGDCFDVGGSAAEDSTVIFDGDCSRVKSIGAMMDAGTIRIEGSAGDHLGAGMRSGEIHVSGNAGDWCGAELRGGRIRVGGNAGHLAGGAYAGSRKGMTGGEILIGGDAGDETGRCMRRGLIAVGGKTGRATGTRMIAGTILAGGSCDRFTGAGMKRGTIIVLSPSDDFEWMPTFREGERFRPPVLRMIFRHLRKLSFSLPEELMNAGFRQLRGDFLAGGQGELLIRADGTPSRP